MIWISISNYLFWALLLSGLTGSIFFLLWLLLDKTILKSDCVLSKKMLRFTLHAYWIPLLFVVLMIRYNDEQLMASFRQGEDTTIKHRMLEMSPQIMRTIMLCVTGWLSVVAVITVIWAWQYLRLKRLLQDSVPETEPAVLACYKDACIRAGIRKEIPLVRNDLVHTPFAAGMHHHCVVLPFEEYTGQELGMILAHELFHCKQKDLQWRYMALWINLLQAWNPFIYLTRRALREKAECVCDYYVCMSTTENFSAKTYFSIILSRAEGERGPIGRFAAGFGSSASELRRRVASMRNYQIKGTLKKGMAAVAVTVFILSGSMTTYAAGNEIVGAQHEWYDDTNVGHAVIEEPAEVHVLLPDKAADAETVVMYSVDVARSTNNINWDVPAGQRYTTGYFSLTANTVVSVAAKTTPSGKTVWVGLEYQDGTKYYLVCTGSVANTITAPKKGYYRFFAENKSDVTINVEASYVR